MINVISMCIWSGHTSALCPPGRNRHKMALKNGMNLNHSFVFVEVVAFIPRFA